MRCEVGTSSGVVSANVRHIKLGIALFFSVSLFLVPYFVVSALCLKCTKHVGCNNNVVQ